MSSKIEPLSGVIAHGCLKFLLLNHLANFFELILVSLIKVVVNALHQRVLEKLAAIIVSLALPIHLFDMLRVEAQENGQRSEKVINWSAHRDVFKVEKFCDTSQVCVGELYFSGHRSANCTNGSGSPSFAIVIPWPSTLDACTGTTRYLVGSVTKMKSTGA